MENIVLKIMVGLREHDLKVKQSLEEGHIRRELAALPVTAAGSRPLSVLGRLWRTASGARHGRWIVPASPQDACGRLATTAEAA